MNGRQAASSAFDELLSEWLDERAKGPEPDELLDRVATRTAGTKPLPAWRLPERWIPHPIRSLADAQPEVVGGLLVLALLLLVLIAVALGAGARRLPAPFGLARAGMVAFVSDGHVWTASSDGGSRRQLTDGDRIEGGPSFSRDGTRIAYTRYAPAGAFAKSEEWSDLVVADVDGRNEIVLDREVHAQSPASWSPDGRFLVYSKIVGDRDQVVIAATDGSSVRVLTHDSEANWAPIINPNGSTIAFVKGYPTIIGLYAVELDGTRERRLTSAPFDVMDGGDWSPDGLTLLYAAGGGLIGDDDVFAVGLDGRPERRVIASPGNDQSPAWSPDGRRFAYLHGAIEDFGIFVADADGANAHEITAVGLWFAPQWSPDGLHVLAVDARRSGSSPIVAVLDPAGLQPATSFALPDVSGLGRADQSSWQRLAP
jgi:Tol biopolymer transport system component